MLFSPEDVIKVQEKFKPGMRVVLDQMGADPNPIPAGMEGTVVEVDGLGTIHVDWDNGRRLGLLLGVDTYHLSLERSDPSRDEGR